MDFKLTSDYAPTGDQPQAIERLAKNIKSGVNEQVLLGVTGSGKTFTMANLISGLNRPALVISHNKTLAAQLYQEFKIYFPQNAVSYFVSYYDFYQPEAYIPQTDTYIEKETEINAEIDKLRLSTTTNILTRADTIVIASVSCIYNIGSPKEYGSFILELRPGVSVNRQSVFARLVELQYERADFGFHRGSFRVRGENIDIFPAYEDTGIRIEMEGMRIRNIFRIDPVSGQKSENLAHLVLYPAKHYMTDVHKQKDVFKQIEADLEIQVARFKSAGRLVEAQRLSQKVRYDLEMIQEVGYVNGIENYSRYFDGRQKGDPPYTLLDYYKEAYRGNWLLFIDESHMTIPQIRGMYNGDRSRKQTLVDFGFRLPAAMDNRPLKFAELLRRLPDTVYVSATPDEWEISRAAESAGKLKGAVTAVVEQLIRPTGLVDPEIEVRPITNQIKDLMTEITARTKKKERVLVTTLTKRTAEDLAGFLEERKIKVHYLHSDVLTLERTDILDNLRRGTYDVIVGINLLREGLDLPEVSLVVILDADKEGFLRSEVSLIQTMGRAARHISGRVIMYADHVTGSMQRAISEVGRRRQVQLEYNAKHAITPKSITKPFRDRLTEESAEVTDPIFGSRPRDQSYAKMLDFDIDRLTPQDRKQLVKKLGVEMRIEAEALNFELAANIRDKIRELKTYS